MIDARTVLNESFAYLRRLQETLTSFRVTLSLQGLLDVARRLEPSQLVVVGVVLIILLYFSHAIVGLVINLLMLVVVSWVLYGLYVRYFGSGA